MPKYKLKYPGLARDWYEGEVRPYMGFDKEDSYREIFKASGKFTDGVIREDKQVGSYISQCKDIGKKYGLYHFLRPHDIQRQADVFLSVIHKYGKGHMPVIVDVEIKTTDVGISNALWQGHIKTFLDLIEKDQKEKSIIYTSGYFWNDFVCINGVPPAWTNLYPLWTAQYPYPQYVDGTPAPTILPKGWTTWSIWQYAEDGRTQGYYANDYNIFSNDYILKLNSEYENGTVEPPVIEPVPPTVTYEKEGRVLLPSLNIRSGAGTAFSVIGGLYENDIVYGDVAADKWFKVFKVKRANGKEEIISGYCATHYSSDGYYQPYLFIKDLYDTQDVVQYPYDGYTLITKRYGKHTTSFISIIDMNKVQEAFITNTNGSLVKVSDMAFRTDADMVVNMDAWDNVSPYKPQGVAVSNGQMYSSKNTGVPFINISKDLELGVAHNTTGLNLYNVASGFRYIVQNETIKEYLDGTTIEYIERHPRKGIGVINNKKLIIITTNGRSSDSMGLTLRELAEIFIEYGTQIAFDGDSGSSVAQYVNDRLIGVPTDGVERPVVNHLVIKMINSDGGGVPTMGKIKLTTSEAGKNRNLRKDALNGQAHIYGSTISYLDPKSFGVAYDDDAYTYESDVYSVGNLVAKKSDIWYKVREVNSASLPDSSPSDARGKYLWTAYKHLGVLQLNVENIVDAPVSPQPVEPSYPSSIWVAIEENGQMRKYNLEG